MFCSFEDPETLSYVQRAQSNIEAYNHNIQGAAKKASMFIGERCTCVLVPLYFSIIIKS